MSAALITGSAGLIGSQATRHFAGRGLDIAGIDNDLRGISFGAEASTAWDTLELKAALGSYFAQETYGINRQRWRR